MVYIGCDGRICVCLVVRYVQEIRCGILLFDYGSRELARTFQSCTMACTNCILHNTPDVFRAISVVNDAMA